MSDAPVIRPSTIADAADVHRVVLAAWQATVDPRSSGHRLTLTDVEDHFAGGGGGFVAEADEQILATVLWAVEGDTVEVMKLGVLPGHRALGLGPALLQAVEAHAAITGAARTLLAVSRYSPRLVGWYESLGYVIAPGEVYAHASPTSPPPTVLVRPLSGRTAPRRT